MAVQEFGCAVKNKINAMSKWLLQIGSSKRVVYRNPDIFFFCKFCEFLYIYTLQSGIGGSFEMHEFDLRIAFDGFLCFVEITQIRDDRVDAILWKYLCYQFF